MTSLTRFRTFMVAATVLATASVALAQTPSLGSVARKEQERRKATGPAKKVLTNADLPKVSAPAAPAPAGDAAAPAETPQTPAAAAAAPAPASAPGAGEPEKDEAWWRGRIAEPREALRRNEVLVLALQSRVNALSADFVARDDPYQRARLGDERLKALAELDRVQAEIADLKQQIADIEDEARRAGVPPGWLR